MLYGIAPVEQALRHRRRVLERLFVKQGDRNERVRAIVAQAEAAGVPVVETRADDLARRAESTVHQGVVLACGALPTTDLKSFLGGLRDDPALLVALDQVEDPQNLGGLVRTSAFLGADAVFLHRSRSAPLSAAASKASAGALEYFPVVEGPNLARALDELADALFQIVGAALGEGARDFREVEPERRLVLVLGSEGRGLRRLTRDKCDELVVIPGREHTESLNVTVAAGVLLAHFGRVGPSATRS